MQAWRRFQAVDLCPSFTGSPEHSLKPITTVDCPGLGSSHYWQIHIQPRSRHQASALEWQDGTRCRGVSSTAGQGIGCPSCWSCCPGAPRRSCTYHHTEEGRVQASAQRNDVARPDLRASRYRRLCLKKLSEYQLKCTDSCVVASVDQGSTAWRLSSSDQLRQELIVEIACPHGR